MSKGFGGYHGIGRNILPNPKGILQRADQSLPVGVNKKEPVTLTKNMAGFNRLDRNIDRKMARNKPIFVGLDVQPNPFLSGKSTGNGPNRNKPFS